MPDPDAKATYHNAIVHITGCKADQTMYYLAHPTSGRKVRLYGSSLSCGEVKRSQGWPAFAVF